MKFKKFSTMSLIIGIFASMPIALELKKGYFTKNISNIVELANTIQEEESNLSALDAKKEIYWTFGKTPPPAYCSFGKNKGKSIFSNFR